MIKLVAFDWNGTLLSDTYAVFHADNEVLKKLGEKEVSYGDFLKYFEVPIKNYYMSLGLSKKKVDENINLISDVFHDSYEEKAQKSRTRANTKTILKWLKKEKIPAIIISNHIKDKIQIHLKRLKIENYFEDVIGNYSKSSPLIEKNKQKRLVEYLDKSNINHKEVLIVGDSTEEIEIAKEIGAISVAISGGNISSSRLKAARPDYLITDLGNLINIVKEINTI
ncbi:MAG TPA: HAD hydrolase-like protein [Candidatus Saccharimonadales bacterium]|nr:HAD hydrolase-like protein [Candidatus Saccharimonadales bacterium]